MTSIADKLGPDELAAVDLAVKRTYADLNPDERLVAEIAIYRASNLPSGRQAYLAKLGMEAIYAERARQSRLKAQKPRQVGQITKGEAV